MSRHLGIESGYEMCAAVLLFVAQLVLKIWDVFHYRFDSDESQHLHVVWAWTHGLIQYRDVFDNHMPLFQIACAPLLGLFGEHPRDLYVMRLLMVPLYVLSMWAVFRIGSLVFSRRIATWSVIAAGCCGRYFFCTTEFRTDNLWNLFWLLSVLVLLRGALCWRSALVAGLLFGLAFAVSMKSTVMLLALVAGAAITLSLFGWGKARQRSLRLTRSMLVFAGCAVLPPLAIVAFFTGKGLWPEMRYCVVAHNLGSQIARSDLCLHLLIFPAAMPLVIWLTRKFVASSASAPGAFRRSFLCATCGSYLVVLLSFWHHITRQDYLPFFPLASILAVAGLSSFAIRVTRESLVRISLPAPAFAVTLAMFVGLLPRIPHDDAAEREIHLVRDVLAVSGPNDYVFDCKGETVFRPRPVFEVFEGLTRERIHKGLLADDVPERCVATHAGIAVMEGRLTDADRQFIRSAYLPVRHGLWVAGCFLKTGARGSGEAQFNVTIPGEYEIVASNGEAVGSLDGELCNGPRFLSEGSHTFVPAMPANRLAVVWAKAAERHFTPLALNHRRS